MHLIKCIEKINSAHTHNDSIEFHFRCFHDLCVSPGPDFLPETLPQFPDWLASSKFLTS